jgi:type VI secretion system protein ImpJ
MTLARAGRPIWNEGMLMCPQHMQQQDLYHEQHLEDRLLALSAAPWGALNVQLDGAALRAGTLQLHAFKGVLPDGTPLTFDATSPNRPSARPIAPHFPARGDAVVVHLALPLLREGVANYALSGEPLTTQRYRGLPQRIHDLVHATKDPRDLQVSEPAPSCLFDTEPRKRLHHPQDRRARARRGRWFSRLSETFIPPCLNALERPPRSPPSCTTSSAAPSPKRPQARRGAARPRRRQDRLHRRELEKSLLPPRPRRRDPLAQALQRHPRDRPAHRSSTARSARARRLADDRRQPKATPPTSRRSSTPTCAPPSRPLVAEVRRLLSKEFDPLCIEIPLRPHQGNSWVGEFRDERLLHCTAFVLAVEVEGDLVVASNEIPEVTKIASWQRIAAIVRLNALGVPIRPTFRPPAEVAIQPKTAYFLIDTTDPLWLELVAARKVAIYLRPPYDPQRAKARLFGIPPKGVLTDARDPLAA